MGFFGGLLTSIMKRSCFTAIFATMVHVLEDFPKRTITYKKKRNVLILKPPDPLKIYEKMVGAILVVEEISRGGSSPFGDVPCSSEVPSNLSKCPLLRKMQPWK